MTKYIVLKTPTEVNYLDMEEHKHITLSEDGLGIEVYENKISVNCYPKLEVRYNTKEQAMSYFTAIEVI